MWLNNLSELNTTRDERFADLALPSFTLRLDNQVAQVLNDVILD